MKCSFNHEFGPWKKIKFINTEIETAQINERICKDCGHKEHEKLTFRYVEEK